MRRPIVPRITLGALLCDASLLAPPVVWANDGISAAAGGGIVLGKTDAIAMKKEVLEISVDKISVDYDFVNE
jgi:hypothetical protein